MNQILINARNKEEVRIAFLDKKELVGLNIENSLIKKNKGNVYKGKITRIETSLNAVFVEYGREKQGFLPFKEISHEYLNLSDGQEPSVNALKEGQEIIIQVEKEERRNKGAALTTFISLAGAYSILIPDSSKGIGISRQIEGQDRDDLKTQLKAINLPENTGLIIRTSGAKKNTDELQWEVDYLLKLWGIIKDVFDKYEAPFLIYQENDVAIRTVRDYLREDIDSVYIDEKKTYDNIKDFVTFVLPQYLDKLKLYEAENQSLFEYIGIEKQVHSVFEREVSLKSGGTIVFDPTEALTSIDINSAKSNKKGNIEQTALHTNLEAAKEIAKQAKLRDLGGLLVVDFIDMADKEHKEQVENMMKIAIKGDKARFQLDTISKFGLMEMSRQRLKPSILESTQKVCNVCEGSGTMPTVPSLSLDILREIEKISLNQEVAQLTVQSTVDVITYLLNEKRITITQLEETLKIKIVLLPNPYIHFPNWSMTKQKDNKSDNKQHSFQRMHKPQYSLSENGLFEIEEKPVVKASKPHTKIPERKKGLFEKLFGIFKKKKVKKKKHYKKRNNTNNRRRYNKQKSQQNTNNKNSKPNNNNKNSKPNNKK
jgi:ribonuclease E